VKRSSHYKKSGFSAAHRGSCAKRVWTLICPFDRGGKAGSAFLQNRTDIVRVYVGSGDGAVASLPEKFEAELNLAGGCRSTGDRASGSGKAGRFS